MAVGLQALADGKGDAFVSAGSTGALLVGATFLVKRIKGVKRPVIGGVMPSAESPFILVDTGANVECSVPMLCQFAHLGNIYMQKILGVENPRVALANIGAEETKGTKLQVEAYKALSEEPDLNFIGNIEVTPLPVWHYKLPIVGFKIGNLAYITDAKEIPDSTIDIIHGIDTLVINALRHEEHLSHMNLEQALGCIEKINPRIAYLTHLADRMGCYNDVDPGLPSPVHLAYDNLVIDIP